MANQILSQMKLVILFVSLVIVDSILAASVPPYNSTNEDSQSPADTPEPADGPSQERLPSANAPFSVAERSPKGGRTTLYPTSFLTSPLGKSVDPGIRKICDSTDYSPLCLASIKPFLNGKTDPISVLKMHIRASVQATKTALTLATNLASAANRALVPTRSALNDCLEMYKDALDNFQDTLNAIPSCDTGTMNSMLSAALNDFVTCDDGFAEAKSPMAEINDKLHKMSSNCLAIVSLIK
ncbi:hypothetical protein Nepgr_018399 [Nepenthes gracilis]|uniref:Pectinesterase inhibitor domain-containing protein n=1 Tax=Nepenthes gracilis TaxID=150966 RepID=A0AAD3XTD9_NEPGR|nr:hypothetical protein Nepgr_018399 [Nepenthes gracilis]